MLSVRIFTLLLLVTFTDRADAQPLKGYSEFSGTVGAISGDEINTGGDRAPIIYHLASSYFVDWKYFVSNGFAVGLAGGVQKFSGDINDDWAYGINAVYGFTQVNITFAPEITYLYYKRRGFESYGGLGIGFSYFYQDRDYYGNSTGGGDRFPATGYIPNVNFTALGLRFGTDFSFFAELGYGYKGMINGGLSYRFNCRKHNSSTTYSSYPVKVIYLPYRETDAKNLDYLGAVRSGSPRFVDRADFDTQLKVVADKTVAKGGNVLRMYYIEDHRQSGRYKIKGTAWSTPDFDSLYAQKERARNKPFSKEKCSYIVIYPTANSMFGSEVFLNDTSELELHHNTKMIIKLTHEGPLSLSTGDHDSEVRIDAVFGKYYYVKVNPLNGYCTIAAVSNLQGELESSLTLKKEEISQ